MLYINKKNKLLLHALFLIAKTVKNLPAIQETWVWSLGREDPLEKERATHSSILAWRIPWTEKPGELPSMQSQRAGHNWEANTHATTSMCTLHRHTLKERGHKREYMTDDSTYMKLNRETIGWWWSQNSGSLEGGGQREELTGFTRKSFGEVDIFCILIWVVKYLYIWL